MQPPHPVEWFRTAVVGGWIAVLVIGGAWIHFHPRPTGAQDSSPQAGCLPAASRANRPGFVATRDLAMNHWIGPGDLDLASPKRGAAASEVLWRYAACEVKAGEVLLPVETRPVARVTVPAGRVTHLLPLRRDARLSTALNAGSTFEVWEGGKVVARALEVLATQCPIGQTPPSLECWAVVAATPDDTLRLQASSPDAIAIVLTATP
jgi:hypothetical protein